jgi:hypothetical protein
VADKPPTWPRWWEWDVVLTHHVRKRMIDRGFTELDLWGMLDRASGLHPGVTPGRWVIVTRFGGVLWHVVVEPDLDTRLLVVVTAFAKR